MDLLMLMRMLMWRRRLLLLLLLVRMLMLLLMVVVLLLRLLVVREGVLAGDLGLVGLGGGHAGRRGRALLLFDVGERALLRIRWVCAVVRPGRRRRIPTPHRRRRVLLLGLLLLGLGECTEARGGRGRAEC